MNARTVTFCMLGSVAFSGTADARLKPIDTGHDAAGALHAGIVVLTNAYHYTAAFAFPAEARALELLDPLSPTAPQASATGPLVVPCRGGGSYSAQWRDRADAGGCSFELRVDYSQCRNEKDGVTTEEDGPVSIAVLLSSVAQPTVLSVRYGSEAAASVPARDFTRKSYLPTSDHGLFLEAEVTANYAVRGRFMQEIGEVGQLEGDFVYEIRGWQNEVAHAFFPDGTPADSATGFSADDLFVRGSQRRQPGGDGVRGSEDDTFDIDLRYRSGTLTRQHRGPDGANDRPFAFDDLTITSSERLVLGGKTVTLDGTVSVAFPTVADERCVSGTFRFATRQPLLDQPPSGMPSPWFVRGGLQINQNVGVSFSAGNSMDSFIDISLNRGAPVRFEGLSSLESTLPCFVSL